MSEIRDQARQAIGDELFNQCIAIGDEIINQCIAIANGTASPSDKAASIRCLLESCADALLREVDPPNRSVATTAKDRCLATSPDDASGKPWCVDCGLPYEQFPLDLLLPRAQWLTIHPSENGLLCAQCIVARCAKIPGATVVHAVVEVTPPEVDPPAGVKTEYRVGENHVDVTDPHLRMMAAPTRIEPER